MQEISMADKLRRTEFLGREFLTWLMVRSACDEGVFRLDDGTVIEVFFERAVTLEGDNPAREMVAIKVDDPTESEEVRLALRLGKRVAKARLMVLVAGHEFSLSLDGATLLMRSVRLPEALSTDYAEVMTERSLLSRELEDAIHKLFLQFVRVRLDHDAWGREAHIVRTWVYPPVAGA